MGHKAIALIIISLFITVCLHAYAGEEEVYVAELADINLVIVRSNGQAYRIQNGIGCRSLWKYRLGYIIIDSPGDSFLAEGSKIKIPDIGQSCEIHNAQSIGPWGKTLPKKFQEANLENKQKTQRQNN